MKLTGNYPLCFLCPDLFGKVFGLVSPRSYRVTLIPTFNKFYKQTSNIIICTKDFYQSCMKLFHFLNTYSKRQSIPLRVTGKSII